MCEHIARAAVLALNDGGSSEERVCHYRSSNPDTASRVTAARTSAWERCNHKPSSVADVADAPYRGWTQDTQSKEICCGRTMLSAPLRARVIPQLLVLVSS